MIFSHKHQWLLLLCHRPSRKQLQRTTWRFHTHIKLFVLHIHAYTPYLLSPSPLDSFYSTFPTNFPSIYPTRLFWNNMCVCTAQTSEVWEDVSRERNGESDGYLPEVLAWSRGELKQYENERWEKVELEEKRGQDYQEHEMRMWGILARMFQPSHRNYTGAYNFDDHDFMLTITLHSNTTKH